MLISSSQLQPIKELYDRGKYLQAHQSATVLAPLKEWEGTEALLLAGRLVGVLGARKLMRRFHLRAWREDRAHPEATYYYARAIWEWRGPWRAWMFIRRIDELPDADQGIQSDWLGMCAGLYGLLRDFEIADQMIARAEALAPNSPWLWIEKAQVLEYEDRYEDALLAARRSLELRPNYRPAIQSISHLLSLLDREHEAKDLLEDAVNHLECPSLLAQLAQLQLDLGDFHSAQTNFQRSIEMSTLLEPDLREWMNSRLADAAYLCGDFERARLLAEQSGDGFYKTIGQRLGNLSQDKQRVLLPIGFIRQHHVTCAPATLTTISKFWQMPAEHLSIAEQICYGGTTDHSERKWAEQNGWIAREFCANWEDTKTLIDRGVPFTLATVEPGNAHLQAVIGYDERRGSLLIRDPYIRSLSEGLIPQLFEHYRSNGPRAMALVPSEKSSLLEGLNLKEESLYDKLHSIQRTLFEYRREEAQSIWQKMDDAAPNHRLTLNARLAIAWYDEDQVQVLSCVEKLLEQFPDDANLKMQKVLCLRMLARRSERLEYLKKICKDEKSDPLFWQQLANELSEDARDQKNALNLLHRALRLRPLDAGNYYQLANIRWAQRKFDEALSLYRFSSCLKDTSEQYVQSYFIAARHLRRTQEALGFLIRRFERFGTRSGFPARTLSWAYEQTGQSLPALEVLRLAIQMRPEDGDLMLYASDVFARHGDFDQAAEYLENAQGKATQTQWLRGSAIIASYRAELKEALRLWKLVAEAEPLSLDANRYVAQFLAETEDREAALEYLRSICGRFPHSLPLHQLLVDWLRDDPEAAEKVLRHIVEIEPTNAWARRELSYNLCMQRRVEEALEEGVIGLELEPDSPFSHCAIGTIYSEMGNATLARQSFCEALRLSVDTEFAITELMANSQNADERRASLDFIRQELIRQVTFGDGLLAYRQVARAVLDGEDVLKLLQAALDARPDLWQAWSSVVYQLMDMQRLDEALDLARNAAERFPLVPRLWLDLALVHQARLERDDVIEALKHALRINPAWSLATQQLAEAYQHAGDFQSARQLIEQAIAYSPMDYANYGYLAEILWQTGDREQAIDRIQHALTIEPGYDWGWRALREWSPIVGKPELALDCAKALTEKRPGQWRSWLVLAQTEGQDAESRLKAIDRAIELNPKLIDAHSLRSRLLCQMQRYDEARAACRPEIFAEHMPAELRCAEAVVDAERGDLPSAIAQLQNLVKDQPNFFPAWNLLADWFRSSNRTADYLEAARQMVRLVPHRAIPLGYLADAQLLFNEVKSAKQTLLHAMTLDPTYEYASTTLFDLQLQDYELDEAEQTLQVLRQQIGGDMALVCSLKLAGKREDFARAREYFKSLCLSPTANSLHFRQALEADMKADWGAIVDEVIDEIIDFPEANQEVGGIFVERCVAKRQWTLGRSRLIGLPYRNELWRRGVTAYLEATARAGEKHQLRKFIEEGRGEFKQHTQIWGSVGYVLLNIGDRMATIGWLSDWRERKDAESWMLWNLSLALRYADRDSESYEVSSFGATLPPDDLTQAHNLVLAYDEFLLGEFEKASARMAKINEPTLRDWDRHLFRITSVLQEAGQLLREGKPSQSEHVKRLISMERETKYFGDSDLLVRLNHRAALKLANEDNDTILLIQTRLKLLLMTIGRSFSFD